MNKLILTFLLLTFTGCGAADRTMSRWTGKPSKVCVNGVLYYQFTSGAAVAKHQNGNNVLCGEDNE